MWTNISKGHPYKDQQYNSFSKLNSVICWNCYTSWLNEFYSRPVRDLTYKPINVEILHQQLKILRPFLLIDTEKACTGKNKFWSKILGSCGVLWLCFHTWIGQVRLSAACFVLISCDFRKIHLTLLALLSDIYK